LGWAYKGQPSLKNGESLAQVEGGVQNYANYLIYKKIQFILKKYFKNPIARNPHNEISKPLLAQPPTIHGDGSPFDGSKWDRREIKHRQLVLVHHGRQPKLTGA
jgi:hypothetical protein